MKARTLERSNVLNLLFDIFTVGGGGGGGGLKGRDENFNWYTNAFMSAPAIYKYTENKLVGRQVRINNSLPA